MVNLFLSEPLYQIEPKLNPTWFVKISQSEIVNLRYVKQWSFEGGGTIKIEMINGLGPILQGATRKQLEKY